MKISKSEQDAIQRVVQAGRIHGFGNMISHLQSAWAKFLIDYGMDAETAGRCAEGGYPIQMHLDLMDKGEWDETGSRYRENGVEVV